ncbi:hypothetical protein ACFQY7_12255 [Actinomadura luteofluorescens]|uniref:hypothetical protein n=1 Tax=Actinomadura luteofluorescens TaxID=46163 RepID=UPI00363FEC26
MMAIRKEIITPGPASSWATTPASENTPAPTSPPRLSATSCHSPMVRRRPPGVSSSEESTGFRRKTPPG